MGRIFLICWALANGALVIALSVGAYEIVELKLRILNIEAVQAVFRLDVSEEKAMGEQSLQWGKGRLSGNENPDLVENPPFENGDNSQIKIRVDGLPHIERPLYAQYYARIPAETQVTWDLTVMKNDREIKSYANVEFFLEGRDKHMFRWNNASKKLEFMGTSYDRKGYNEYFVAVCVWDLDSYKSKSIVLSVKIDSPA